MLYRTYNAGPPLNEFGFSNTSTLHICIVGADPLNPDIPPDNAVTEKGGREVHLDAACSKLEGVN